MRNPNHALRPGEGLGDFMAFTSDAQQRRRALFSRLTDRHPPAEGTDVAATSGAVWWPLLADGGPLDR